MSSAAPQGDRETEIVIAAERTFSRFGYRRTSMEGIAEEAGISRAGLYTYFSRKEALFQAVVRWLHEQSLAGAAEVAERDGLTIEERLVGMFEARLGFFIDRYRDLDQGQELFTESSRQCAEVVGDSKRRYRRLLTRVLREADQDGSIRLAESGLSAAAAADLVARAVEGLKASAFEPLTPKVFRERLGSLIGLLVRGMGGR
jgi:AcrR family transcriptional regulator